MKIRAKYNHSCKMVTALIALTVFTTGILAQSDSSEYRRDAIEYIKFIETFADRVEQSLKYVTPTAEQIEDYICCKERLKAWAADLTENLRYHAPSMNELKTGKNMRVSTKVHSTQGIVEKFDPMVSTHEIDYW